MARAPSLVLLGVLGMPSAALAQVVDPTNPVQGLTLSIGTLAGLTNSVATLVYAVQGRSFDTPWVVSSFLSSAICGAFAVGLTLESAEVGEAGIFAAALAYYLLALGPAGWAVRGALHEAAPGQPFDPERRAREMEDRSRPWSSSIGVRTRRHGMEPGLAPSRRGAAVTVTLPPLRF